MKKKSCGPDAKEKFQRIHDVYKHRDQDFPNNLYDINIFYKNKESQTMQDCLSGVDKKLAKKEVRRRKTKEMKRTEIKT